MSEYAEIDYLPLSVRATNVLHLAGLLTIEQIVRAGKDGLMRLPHMGRKSVDEVVAILGERGVMLRSRGEMEVRCERSGMLLMSDPPQEVCRNCGQRWTRDAVIPECKAPMGWYLSQLGDA